MCELFGISSRHPTGIHVSLNEFASRGGDTGPHSDGWGIAFLQEGDVQLIREPRPSASSPHLRFIHDSHAPSALVIAHIRKATQGPVSLRNTQPFQRELGGRAHIFAHNGDLGPIRTALDLAGSRFRSIGDTDSEHAFCYLLSRLEPLWQRSERFGEPPALERRLEVFGDFVDYMTGFGAANFLYCDSDCLFVHAHHRRQDNGSLCAPGLHVLARHEGEDEMVLLASRPLTDENWQPLAEHSVLAIHQGRIVSRGQLFQKLSATG
jgi:predicted glutamine amidotransferase